MTLEEIDTYDGEGCFILTGGQSKLIDVGSKVLFEDNIFNRFDLDRAFGYKKQYDNHSDLINIKWCIGYIPVICMKIEHRKKSVYATFLDRSGTFSMLMRGKRLIQNEWFDFNMKFEEKKGYILKCESNPFYPDELRVIDFRELQKPA